MSKYEELTKAEIEHDRLIFYLSRERKGEGYPRHRLIKDLVFSMKDDGWILNERAYKFPYPHDPERILLLRKKDGRDQLRTEHLERLNKLYLYPKDLHRALNKCVDLGIVSHDKNNHTYRLNPEYESRFSKDRLEMAFYAAMLKHLSGIVENLQKTSYDKIRPFAAGGFLIGLDHKTLSPEMLEDLADLELQLFRSIDRVYSLKFSSLMNKAMRDCSDNVDRKVAERRRRIFIRLFAEDARSMRLLREGDWNALLRASSRNPPLEDASEREINSGRKLVDKLFDGLTEPFIFVTAPSDHFLREGFEKPHPSESDRLNEIIGRSIVKKKIEELHGLKARSPIVAKDLARETALKITLPILMLLLPIVTVYGLKGPLEWIIFAGGEIVILTLLLLFFSVRRHRRRESESFDTFFPAQGFFELRTKERQRKLDTLRQRESGILKRGFRK
jgi:hypothetical protein